MLTQSVEKKISQILNVFETGQKNVKYDAIYIYPDGRNGRRQVTLSYGLTEDGGNLGKLLQIYNIANGQYSDQLLPYFPKIGTGVLHNSDSFKVLLKEAAIKDDFFNECQDFCFRALYLKKGYEKAKEYGIITNLGIAVIVDSVLQGSLDAVSLTFREARPSKGGEEKTFIKAYLNARKKWLISKGAPLSNSIYRVASFQKAIDSDNWNLSKPFDANGTIID